MSTELFFSAPAPQNPSSRIRIDGGGSAALDGLSKSRTGGDSSKADPDKFLHTLKAAFQDQDGQKSEPVNLERHSEKTSRASANAKIDQNPDDAVLNEELLPTAAHEPVRAEVELDENFAAFMEMLSEIGIYDGAGRSGVPKTADGISLDRHQLAEIKSWMARFDQNPLSQNADVKVLFERLAQFIATHQTAKAGVPVAGVTGQETAGNVQTDSSASDGSLKENISGTAGQKGISGLNAGSAPSDPQSAEAALMDSRSDIETDAGHSDMRTRRNGPNANQAVDVSSSPIPAGSRGEAPASGMPGENRQPGIETQPKSNVMPKLEAVDSASSGIETQPKSNATPKINTVDNAFSGTETQSKSNGMAKLEAVDSALSGIETQPKSSGMAKLEAVDSALSGIETQPKSNAVPKLEAVDSALPGIETQPKSNAVPKLEAVDSILSGVEMRPKSDAVPKLEAADIVPSKDRETPATVGRPIGSSETAVAGDGKADARTAMISDNRAFGSGATSGMDSADRQASGNQIQSTNAEEPLSKVIQEIQQAQRGAARMDANLKEEPISKVVKSEAGAIDNSLLNASGQSADKASEVDPPLKAANAGQGTLRTETLDQIVRRAAIQLRNGQHEARIDLKPDFLGHIRMQIISENQQITVKILAEHGFVKDMIENNVHQLKADLQQQGLEVGKVEVSVSQDSEDANNPKEKLAQSRAKPGTAGHRQEDQPAREHQNRSRQAPRPGGAAATVDYFA